MIHARDPGELDPDVLRGCREILQDGSRGFSAASHLLPPRLRAPVTALYSFCRVSDDAIDEAEDPVRVLKTLRRRVQAIFDGRPFEHAADRAMAWLVVRHEVPRAPIDALLDGYAFDVRGGRCELLSDVRRYSSRVAASVGVVMTWLMGVRERWVLRRAADLGVAMQLTNIARDVGEDARIGRIYLPLAWLRAEGGDLREFLDRPSALPGIRVAVCRLLSYAAGLYARARAGVAGLPRDCRCAIVAASDLYQDISRVIRGSDYDSVSARAGTSGSRKAWLLSRAVARASAASAMRSRRGRSLGREPALPEVLDLIDGL